MTSALTLGATVTDDGARFVVWAPEAHHSVEVVLDDRRLALAPVGPDDDLDDLWTVQVDGVGHGDRYAYVLDGGEPLPEALGHVPQGDPGGVRGHDGAIAANGLDPAEQGALDLQVLHHPFDDPVTLRQPAQVVVEVAHLHEGRGPGRREGGRLALPRPLQTSPHQRVLVVSLPGRDVQEQGGNAHVGEVGGDGGAHDAGPEHGGLADPIWC